jgi:hypothetical protein
MMSGPKVVRIVTRDEIIARCRTDLARLDAAFASWRTVCEKTGGATPEDIVEVEGRRNRVHELLELGLLATIAGAVSAEVSALKADGEARVVRAAEAAARERKAHRQAAAVASGVLAALDGKGTPLPPEVRGPLERAAAGGTLDGVAISRALELLSGSDHNTMSPELLRLAKALKSGDDRKTFAQWLAEQPLSPADADIARVERQLVELSALGEDKNAAGLTDRLAGLSSIPAERRSLYLDSLELDLARALTAARRRGDLLERLRVEAMALAGDESIECVTMLKRIMAELEAPTSNLELLFDQAVALSTRTRSAVAAEARRRAVLEGLAQVGYQVSEGMQTALARDGRIVLKRASQSEYGVEIKASDEMERLQVRAVAFRGVSAPVDAARDREAETTWCSDLGRLREQLAAGSGELVIEHAQPIGATPLKVISEGAVADADVRAPRVRSALRNARKQSD